jgi:predicted phage replisome organizer
MQKRYYWFKLKEDFMDDKRMKKLIKLSGGNSYFSIYIKLLLSTLRTEGVITYENLEDTLAGELALVLNEDEESVQITIDFLMKTGLMLDMGNNQYYLPEVAENLGSEGASAQRVREYRERQKALHCNSNVTPISAKRNGEKEKEKDIYIKDIKSSRPSRLNISNKKKRSPFKKPTVEEVAAYIQEKGYPIDAQEFVNYYEDRDWYCKDVPMRNWKNALYSWTKNQRERWPQERIQKASENKNKNSFQQNTYDFDKLEAELIQN